MKTNDQDIEKMATSYINSQEYPPDGVVPEEHEFTPHSHMIDTYKAGFKACEAKMMEEAAKDFEEWFLHYPSWRVTMSRYDSCKIAFQAGALSQAKRVKELEDALKFYVLEENNIVARVALKQGGER